MAKRGRYEQKPGWVGILIGVGAERRGNIAAIVVVLSCLQPFFVGGAEDVQMALCAWAVVTLAGRSRKRI